MWPPVHTKHVTSPLKREKLKSSTEDLSVMFMFEFWKCLFNDMWIPCIYLSTNNKEFLACINKEFFACIFQQTKCIRPNRASHILSLKHWFIYILIYIFAIGEINLLWIASGSYSDSSLSGLEFFSSAGLQYHYIQFVYAIKLLGQETRHRTVFIKAVLTHNWSLHRIWHQPWLFCVRVLAQVMSDRLRSS